MNLPADKGKPLSKFQKEALQVVQEVGFQLALVEGLSRLDADGPVRLDGELELPDGMAVNWREVAQSFADPCHELLVKSMDGVELRTWTRLFRTRKSPL